MMGTMMLTALSSPASGEQGTFDQLLVTPFRPFEIMVGRRCRTWSSAWPIDHRIADRAVLVSHPVRRILRRSICGAHLVLMAAVGLGLFVSSIAKTMQQAMLYAFILVMPFALLSGLTTPSAACRDSADRHDHQSAALRARSDQTGVFGGAGFANLVGDFLPLLIIGVVTLAGAAWLFRRRLS